MYSIIEEIFLNNEIFEVKQSEEFKKSASNGLESYKKLQEILSEKDNEILEELVNADIEMQAERMNAYFIKGFKIGLRIAIESFQE